MLFASTDRFPPGGSLHSDAPEPGQRDLQYRLLRISGSRKQPGAEEGIMDTVQNYRRLALDCLKMAEAARDPATREDMTRLAHLWARLAGQAKECIASGRSRS